MSAPLARPNPVQWLGYVIGRRLPDDLQDWVRRDLTRPHSAVRQVIRGELVYSPAFLVLALFPGALWIRFLMVLLGVLLSSFYSASFLEQNRHRRLEVHGLPVDLVSEREQRVRDTDRAAYEATYRD